MHWPALESAILIPIFITLKIYCFPGPPTYVAFSPDGQQVVSGSSDQTVRLWNVQTGQQIGVPLHGHISHVTSVASSPDSQQVVSGSSDKTVRVRNVQTAQQTGALPHDGHTFPIKSMASSSNPPMLVASSLSKDILTS
ncbi:hypothetical protein D9757_011176 [Collybiopsis confluens]|uniref:WD40 repeat-like protein n=1 Tax=Collybiopsis confluens TaxID=2823264 RepID=A0A8H5M067_9AGAR|nr:hypothetical protein D9757_011176 [Collybiopsis confluens]